MYDSPTGLAAQERGERRRIINIIREDILHPSCIVHIEVLRAVQQMQPALTCIVCAV